VERIRRAIPISCIDTQTGWLIAVYQTYATTASQARLRDNAATTSEREDAMSAQKITVLNPMGFPPKVVTKPLAPRLSTLEGKTVYLVDCRFDDSDVFLKQMQAWFGEHMPGVRTVFKPISSVYLKDDPTTWEEIKARGHAAIVGVGH
jgi:hypothetical protein